MSWVMKWVGAAFVALVLSLTMSISIVSFMDAVSPRFEPSTPVYECSKHKECYLLAE